MVPPAGIAGPSVPLSADQYVKLEVFKHVALALPQSSFPYPQAVRSGGGNSGVLYQAMIVSKLFELPLAAGPSQSDTLMVLAVELTIAT
jgi:hypothetical protein